MTPPHVLADLEDLFVTKVMSGYLLDIPVRPTSMRNALQKVGRHDQVRWGRRSLLWQIPLLA